MTTATATESTISLDEINRTLDLARERDPSIEPEPGYSDGVQSEPQFSASDRATNLSILAAAAFIKGHAPTEAIDLAVELSNRIQECAGCCAKGGEGELFITRDSKPGAITRTGLRL